MNQANFSNPTGDQLRWDRLAQAMPIVRFPAWAPSYLLSGGMQMVIDAAIASISFWLAYLLRFNGWPPPLHLEQMLLLLPCVVFARLVANYSLGIYRQIWRYISVFDAIRLSASIAIVSIILLLFRFIFGGIETYFAVPVGIICIDTLLVGFGMLGIRLLRRVTYEANERTRVAVPDNCRCVLLVGAGEAGIMTVREIMHRRELGMDICGFLDDDPHKVGTVIHGIRVLGTTSDLQKIMHSKCVQQVIITIASAPRKTIRRIVDICESENIPVKIIPALYEILDDKVTVDELRPVGIEDLLGRDTVDTSRQFEAARPAYAGKRVMVTGGAGSIGSELCRQILLLDPACIILLDKDENAVFEANHELTVLANERGVSVIPVVCNLRIEPILRKVFDTYRPHVVFHAAAYKHVPLMELNVSEAVLNNVLGAKHLLDLCRDYAIERCIMISTDKAVRPTSIMGATKRVAELMFQSQVAINHHACRYSCVRFGNVLGSRGSVVPIFRDQIRKGGPVTVTHPDMVRYFMTISEASQLIIQAGFLGEKGEIFLLNMGEPVRIVDLAKDMIRLSGLTPGEDIDIAFTGTRPGEKLIEELLIAEEGAKATLYEKIFVAPPLEYEISKLEEGIKQLIAAANYGKDHQVRQVFSNMHINFQPARQTHVIAGSSNEAQPGIRVNPTGFGFADSRMNL